MLLRNESRISHIIHIKLVFDDNTQRELDIQVNDCVQVSYRKNGCLRQGVGVIRKIQHINISAKSPGFCNRESAIITLDMSEDHVCCVDKIDIYDIVDIRHVRVDNLEENNNNDFIVNNNECHCCCNKPEQNDSVAITEKGAVIYE